VIAANSSVHRPRGATLVVGLILLSLVTLLGLAGATSAHVEQVLAQNEQFRENAASAASAGIEIAISRIVSSPSPASVPTAFDEPMPGTTDRIEARVRFAGAEHALPQAPGGTLVGAHFDIESTGFSARRATDRQRATVMLVVRSAAATPLPCEPDAPGVRCRVAGDVERLSWQRVAVE
jgi:type II secretory pathway component PulK